MLGCCCCCCCCFELTCVLLPSFSSGWRRRRREPRSGSRTPISLSLSTRTPARFWRRGTKWVISPLRRHCLHHQRLCDDIIVCFDLSQIRDQNRFDLMSSGPRSQHLAGIPVDEPRRVRTFLSSDLMEKSIFILFAGLSAWRSVGSIAGARLNEVSEDVHRIISCLHYENKMKNVFYRNWWRLLLLLCYSPGLNIVLFPVRCKPSSLAARLRIFFRSYKLHH